MITAGNSSQISDGSAALLITTSEKAEALGLNPLARVHTAVARRGRSGDHADRADPGDPEGAQAVGPALDDIGVFEVNEAFAPVPLAWLADFGADPEAEPQRRRDRAGPPARRLRCAAS